MTLNLVSNKDDAYLWHYKDKNDIVFVGESYPSCVFQPFAMIFWYVDSNKEDKFLLEKFFEFYNNTENKKLPTPFEKPDNITILRGKNIMEFPRPSPEQIYNLIMRKDFNKFGLNTQYANYFLERKDFKKTKISAYHNIKNNGVKTINSEINLIPIFSEEYNSWNSKNGIIGLTTHNNICDDISKLICETSKHNTLAREIEEALNKIFSFNTQTI